MKVVSLPLRLANVNHSDNEQEIVFTKEFLHPHGSLSLQPFNVFNNIPVTYNRISREDKLSELIAASYTYTREPGFARTYMVLLDHHRPVCEVDICPALQDELCDYINAITGDYILRILPASPRKIRRRLFSALLQTCLEYFLQFKDVKRIFIESDTENNWQQELLVKNGFRFREMICHQYKDTCLFQYTPSLRKRTH